MLIIIIIIIIIIVIVNNNINNKYLIFMLIIINIYIVCKTGYINLRLGNEGKTLIIVGKLYVYLKSLYIRIYKYI